MTDQTTETHKDKGMEILLHPWKGFWVHSAEGFFFPPTLVINEFKPESNFDLKEKKFSQYN